MAMKIAMNAITAESSLRLHVYLAIGNGLKHGRAVTFKLGTMSPPAL
jgi:hypothetical protein